MEFNRYDTVIFNGIEYYVMDTIDFENKKYLYITNSESEEVLLLQIGKEGLIGVTKEEAIAVGEILKDKYYQKED